MSSYLWIVAVQRPFSINKDENDRTIFSCNFEGNAVANMADFELEIAKIIGDAGLGAVSTTLFIGPKVDLPAGAGPFVRIIDTGGSGPVETHDARKQERFSFQILVHALSYTTGRTRALAIWRLLDGFRNQTVTI